MPQFQTVESFLDQPVWLINSALTHGQRHYYQKLHYNELALTEFEARYINGHRGKDSAPIRASAFQHFSTIVEQFSSNRISAVAANTVMAMISGGMYPQWMFVMTPIDEIKHCQNSISEPEDCWVHPSDIALFAPRIIGGVLQVPLALIDGGVSGDYALQLFPTTKKTCVIEVINESSEPTVRIGAQFVIKENYVSS